MELNTIEEIREFFAKDQFATGCLGATIDSFDSETGIAMVSMDLDERHYNAQGFVMGGVFFSLADFALAVACNVGQPPTASVSSTIEHLRRAKGSRLIAKAAPVKLGRSLAFFEIDVTDDLGNHVARVSSTVMRTEH